MGDRPKDEVNRLSAELRKLKGEIKQLSAEKDEAVEKLSRAMEVFSYPEKLRKDRDRLAAEVEELREFKDEIEPMLVKFVQIEEDHEQIFAMTKELIARLEDAYEVFGKSDAPDSDEGKNRHKGATDVLEAVNNFLGKLTLTKFGLTKTQPEYNLEELIEDPTMEEICVERPLRLPLYSLHSALYDVEDGIKNTITARPQSKKSDMGVPMRAEEADFLGAASWAVTGLDRLDNTKRKAYDIVAKEAGIPRKKLVRFRQKLLQRKKLVGFSQEFMPPKSRSPLAAQRAYDELESQATNPRLTRKDFQNLVVRVLTHLSDYRDIQPK